MASSSSSALLTSVPRKHCFCKWPNRAQWTNRLLCQSVLVRALLWRHRIMKNEASTTASSNVTKVGTEPGDGTTVHANLEDEVETPPGGWRETFRMALDRTRKQRKPRESRQELGRDR